MLEVVFSDSAAGTMAVAIGHKGFLGGATSVIISDGTVSKEERLNHKFCGISDSSRSSVGSYRIASERNIRHQDIRIPVCEES